MSKHTPGPWVVSADPLHLHSLMTVIGGKESGPPQQMIVQVSGFAEWKEAAANVRLIAEAPELLEALKLIANAENSALDLAYCKGIARAAIAKATGGST